MPPLSAILLVLQGALPPLGVPGSVGAGLAPDSARAALRAGLDTLYGGDFARAAAYFGTLAVRDTSDPAPVVFQAGAYIWWASARDSAAFEMRRVDSLLTVALARARGGGGGGRISGGRRRWDTGRGSGRNTGAPSAPRRTPRRCATSTGGCSRRIRPAPTAISDSGSTTTVSRAPARWLGSWHASSD